MGIYPKERKNRKINTGLGNGSPRSGLLVSVFLFRPLYYFYLFRLIFIKKKKPMEK